MKYVYLVKSKNLQTNETFVSRVVSNEAKAKEEVEFWNKLQKECPASHRTYYYIKEPVY